MILTVIPCHAGDCVRAERLLDQILALNRKKQSGHALLVFAPDVPQENRDKLRITAEVAFKSVGIFGVLLPKDLVDKQFIAAHMIALTARHISKHFKSSWLWLEPDCLPLKSEWFVLLENGYERQPLRYMAGHIKYGEAIAMSRIAVYPNDAIVDMEASASMNVPFDFYAVNMSMKSRLFQTVNIASKSDFWLIRPDAVLAHSDKSGALIDEITQQSLNVSELQIGEPVVVKSSKVPMSSTKTASANFQPSVANKPMTTSASAQV